MVLTNQLHFWRLVNRTA